ncbi:MAG: hypothetical protein K6T59_17105, partial [Bryobacteraceae bacterium]|nr:hypothetical protein [Bryobacteraceae bacterium]
DRDHVLTAVFDLSGRLTALFRSLKLAPMVQSLHRQSAAAGQAHGSTAQRLAALGAGLGDRQDGLAVRRWEASQSYTWAQEILSWCARHWPAADVQQAFRSFSTTAQFSTLAREFFTRLSTRYLTYFLSRTLSNSVSGDGRFKNINEHAEFNEALELHCRQATRIIEEFSGGWFSKTKFFEGDITPDKAAGFVHVALKKVRAELAKGGHADER